MNLVLDTNVLVSALLSPFGAPARILDLLLAGTFRAVFDDRVMAEYRNVLQRPKFGFETRSVDDLLTLLAATGTAVTAPVLAVTLPDPSDIMFVEVAAGAGAHLITGNRRHFPPDQCAGIVVVSPAEFIESWRAQQAEKHSP